MFTGFVVADNAVTAPLYRQSEISDRLERIRQAILLTDILGRGHKVEAFEFATRVILERLEMLEEIIDQPGPMIEDGALKEPLYSLSDIEDVLGQLRAAFLVVAGLTESFSLASFQSAKKALDEEIKDLFQLVYGRLEDYKGNGVGEKPMPWREAPRFSSAEIH